MPRYFCIEPLESRIAPALLPPTVIGGILQIFTDSAELPPQQDENVTITQTGPGAFTVNDTVNGVLTEVTGVQGIYLDNDKNTENVFVFSLLGNALPSGLRLELSDGSNDVQVHSQPGGATILGSINFQAGLGTDSFQLGGDSSLAVKKNFTFTGNGGAASLNLAGPVGFAGSVRIINTANFDLSEPGRIAGALLIDNRNVPAAMTPTVNLGIDAVKGVTYLGGAAKDTLRIVAPLTGPLKFTSGDEADTLSIQSPVRGVLTADFGAGADTFQIGTGGSIGGKASLGDGASTDVFSLESDAVQAGRLTVLGGSGNDQFTLKNGAFLAAPLVLDGGAGSNTLTLADGFTATALLSYRGGPEADTVAWGNARTFGGLSLQLGEGANVIQKLAASIPTVAGLIDIRSGSGGLNFLLTEFSGVAAWKFSFKGGTNTINTALDASSVQILGGTGIENITFHDGAIDSLKVALGAGDDHLTFGANFFTSTNRLDGGTGTDTLTGLSIHSRTVTKFEVLA